MNRRSYRAVQRDYDAMEEPIQPDEPLGAMDDCREPDDADWDALDYGNFHDGTGR